MTFKFITSLEEKRFRVDQLTGVLHQMLKYEKLYNQALPLFEDVLNVLLKFGDLAMVSQILVLMNSLKIKRNSSIDNIFFNAIRKNKEITRKAAKDKNMPETKVLKIADLITEMENPSKAKKIYSRCMSSLNYSHKDTIKRLSHFQRRTAKSFKVRLFSTTHIGAK